MGKKTSKGKKIGRGTNKAQRYKAGLTREKNKLKRVMQSNGYEAAVTYAKEHGLRTPIKPVIKENTKRTK